MTSLQMINLTSLIDDATCFELIRHHRWPEGFHCPACSRAAMTAMAMMRSSGIGNGTGAKTVGCDAMN